VTTATRDSVVLSGGAANAPLRSKHPGSDQRDHRLRFFWPREPKRAPIPASRKTLCATGAAPRQRGPSTVPRCRLPWLRITGSSIPIAFRQLRSYPPAQSGSLLNTPCAPARGFALANAMLVVIGKDRDCLLHNDGTVIEFLVHKMHRATRDFTRRQKPAAVPRGRKRRQQRRWMFSMRCGNCCTNHGESRRMYPARQIRSTPCSFNEATTARS
jgi:hypothetical protein